MLTFCPTDFQALAKRSGTVRNAVRGLRSGRGAKNGRGLAAIDAVSRDEHREVLCETQGENTPGSWSEMRSLHNGVLIERVAVARSFLRHAWEEGGGSV